MTIDSERWQNIDYARHLLEALSGTPDAFYPQVNAMRIPKELREIARRLLKHYPERWWIDQQRKP